MQCLTVATDVWRAHHNASRVLSFPGSLCSMSAWWPQNRTANLIWQSWRFFLSFVNGVCQFQPAKLWGIHPQPQASTTKSLTSGKKSKLTKLQFLPTELGLREQCWGNILLPKHQYNYYLPSRCPKMIVFVNFVQFYTCFILLIIFISSLMGVTLATHLKFSISHNIISYENKVWL